MTYLIIILLTVSVIETALIWAVNEYYIGNIRIILNTQAENTASFYKGYLANTDLISNTRKILDYFGNSNVRIQITDTSKKVLADSTHFSYGSIIDTPDITTAIEGKQGSYIGKDPVTEEEIMTTATALRSDTGIVGAIRLTTSLEKTRKVIAGLIFYFIIFGIVIILLVFFISFYLSQTITKPIKKITGISREIARGNMSVRAEKGRNDEIGILSDSINHMASEMQKADALKNEFISSVSHELKTPLTSIKGWAVTLGDTDKEDFEIIKRGIYIIKNETDRLTDMVEDLLDFSRLQSGSFGLQLQKVDINGLLIDVYEQMRPRAERQGIKISNEGIPADLFELSADGRRLRQVMINLLDNSLKFTPQGGTIKVAAGPTQAVENPGHAGYYEIKVEDTGCSIDEDELPMIKNRFYRGRNAAKESGIGLGLAICNTIINSHGGTMDITSEKGKGTKVTIRLKNGR